MWKFFKSRLLSFIPAMNGMTYLLKNEKNTWIHLVATIIVVFAGFFLGIAKLEWALIASAIFAVWFAETINTVFEKLMDFLKLEFHLSIKLIKDLSALAVLLSACYAIIIGVIVFGVRIFN